MMSLVLSTSVKANVRLEQAVKHFEAILTSHQATQFRAHRNSTSTSPPTIVDVRNLLLDVDSLVRAKANTRRAFSPRLSSVVEAVQKFASIGDVFVGGSQNLIACGVWAIIRLALLSITTSLSTLERLSTFFMAIGRSAPRYEDLALLYPQSERLQMYLCEYYIILVNLCRELVIFTQKSAVSLLMSSLSSSIWDSHQTSLEQWSMCIKEEVSSLMAQTIEHDSSLNSSFRAFITGEMKKDSLMKQLKARRKALDACTTYDYETTWKQQRKIGTTELFKDNKLYKRWKETTISETLIIDGKLGSGKTVMMANIIDDLRRDAVVNHANVAYFFCRYDTPDSLKERVILGSLAREMLRTTKHSFPSENETESLNVSTDMESIEEVLLQSLPAQSKTYFVIDGIDECNAKTVRSIQEKLKTIQLSRRLAICISYRTDSLPVTLRTDLLNRSIMIMPEENSDIDDYITMELERRIESGSLALGDPTLIKEIYTTLVAGARGMFLWVALQIDCLCFQKNDEQIRTALLKLPKDLPDLFARLLQEAAVHYDTEHDQTRILELVVSAVRPLQEEEIREALSVEPGNTDWDASKLPNDILSLLACCGSLLIVDEEDRSIRLVHHSVLQYLIGKHKRPSGAILTQHDAHRTFAAILITYLSYEVFQTQVSKAHPKLPIRAMQSTIIRSTLNSSIKRKLAIQILKNVSRSERDAGDIVGQTTMQALQGRNTTDHVFHLYDYARKNLSSHAWVYFDDIEDPIVSLLDNLFVRDKELGYLWRQSMYELEVSDFGTWSSKGNQGLVLMDLLCEDIHPTSPGFRGIFEGAKVSSHPEPNFLVWACTQGRSGIVQRWLRKLSRCKIPYPEEMYGRALYAALTNGKYDVAFDVVKHISELIPKLAFLKWWVSEQIDVAQIEADQLQIGRSTAILDQILQHDNADVLKFLMDCGSIYQSRVDPITWRDISCTIGLRDRCICRNSIQCLRLCHDLTTSTSIIHLNVFTIAQAKMRDELLYEAILLGLLEDAMALLKASVIKQKISQDNQLRCLSLALTRHEYQLVQCMVDVKKQFITAGWFEDTEWFEPAGWFNDGRKRLLNVPRGLEIEASMVDLLLKHNFDIQILDTASGTQATSDFSVTIF